MVIVKLVLQLMNVIVVKWSELNLRLQNKDSASALMKIQSLIKKELNVYVSNSIKMFLNLALNANHHAIKVVKLVMGKLKLIV